MRILDIDLDAFVEPVQHWANPDTRLDPDEYEAWPVEEAIDWLRTRCHLDGPVPGWAVEHHVEIFDRWRDATRAGVLPGPFHVTHLDAHADLGLGAAGYIHLLTDIVHRPVPERDDPLRGDEGLNSATFLAFAVGCRWIGDIDYVFSRGGGSDLHPYLMEGFDARGDRLRLPALTRDDIDTLLGARKPEPTRLEPPVPIRSTPMAEFQSSAGYDLICLTRSPDYTPPTADPLYAAIRDKFIGGPPTG